MELRRRNSNSLRVDFYYQQRQCMNQVMLHQTIGNDDFLLPQRCNVVATLFRMVTTLLQHCSAVLEVLR